MGERCGGTEGRNGSFNPLSVVLPIYDAANSSLSFAHALKIAYEAGGELEIIDVRTETEITEQLGVRMLLERWGILKSGSSRADVLNAGLRVKKIVKNGNKKKVILHRLNYHLHDLLVIGFNLHTGILPFLGSNLVEEILLSYSSPVLFVPAQSESFIRVESGEAVLNNIVITADDLIELRSAINAVKMLMKLFPAVQPEVKRVLAVNHKPAGLLDCSGIQYREVKSEENRKKVLAGEQSAECADLKIIAKKMGNFLQSKLRVLSILHILGNSSCPVFWIPIK